MVVFRQGFERFLLWFIVLQPLIDVFTTLSLRTLHLPVTVGMLVRILVLAAALLYLCTSGKSRTSTITCLYVLSLMGFCVLNLVVSYTYKPIFQPRLELQFLAKAVYFVALLLAYRQFLARRTESAALVPRAIYWAATLVGVVMLLASITGTALHSYSHGKSGVSGWFYSGNEVSAILAMTFPVVVDYAIERGIGWPALLYWIPVWLSTYGLLALGTKTGYVAGLVTLVLLLVAILARGRASRLERPVLALGACLTSATLVAYILVTPFSPVISNTHVRALWLPHVASSQTSDVAEDGLNRDVNHLVYSSRDVYLRHTLAEFRQAPPAQKLFGMGYAGNYRQKPKLVEMDFFDLFFALGAIGTAIWCLPLLWLFGRGLRVWIRKGWPGSTITVSMWMAALLGLGVAGMVGHVLTAPAASIYLAAVIPMLARESHRTALQPYDE
jgi:hypothetical protein